MSPASRYCNLFFSEHLHSSYWTSYEHNGPATSRDFPFIGLVKVRVDVDTKRCLLADKLQLLEIVVAERYLYLENACC